MVFRAPRCDHVDSRAHDNHDGAAHDDHNCAADAAADATADAPSVHRRLTRLRQERWRRMLRTRCQLRLWLRGRVHRVLLPACVHSRHCGTDGGAHSDTHCGAHASAQRRADSGADSGANSGADGSADSVA